MYTREGSCRTMSKDNIETIKKTFSNAVLLPEIANILKEGHTVTLILRGYSMRPFLEDNRDKALLKKTDCIKVGDAVLAEILPHKFVLHRIVKINNDAITLRGDGNLSDEHCLRSDILGKAIGFYRKGNKRVDSTDGTKWKVYSFVWMRLYPIRRYLLAFYRRIWIKLFGTV